jgi:membrane protein required for colicin V production
LPTLSDLPITIFDLAVAAILLISALLAVARGFVRELMSLASWVAAAVIAWFAYPAVHPLLAQAVGTGLPADLLTAAAVFLVPLLVLRIVTGMMAERVASSGFGGLDRVFGLAFGLARGALIVCAAYLLATYIIDERDFPPWVTQARLEPPVRGGATWLAGLLPQSMAADGRASVEGALSRARAGRGQEAAPPPGAPPAGSTDGGYGRSQRQQMDQLIERSR